MDDKKGICCAGNLIVDTTYPIEAWPRQNELTHITGSPIKTVGGAVCNVLMDLAVMDPELRLSASGLVGNDGDGDLILREMGRYPSIDLTGIHRKGDTSFTAVMSNNDTKERTFFQYAGASALYGEADIDWERIQADIFHIGYILLLPHLDEEDPQYGTAMAALLCKAQKHGFKTSIDVVSETGDRFRRLVCPALKYTDYCIINELEAQQSTGVLLREENGKLHRENFPKALEQLHKLGVSAWAVIHCPEMGAGMDEAGNYATCPSLTLPRGYIRGTVGAGDAFCAGVLYGAEKGLSLCDSLKIGVSAAGASLSAPGATAGMVSIGELKALYEKYASTEPSDRAGASC